MPDHQSEEQQDMRRALLISLVSVLGISQLPKQWTSPIINSVMLPAHAQTSCPNILDVDVIGSWLFTDVNGKQIEMEFINEQEIRVKNQLIYGWSRLSDGTLDLGIRGPAKGWEAYISMETNCVASEITVTVAPGDQSEFIEGPYETPLIGTRV